MVKTLGRSASRFYTAFYHWTRHAENYTCRRNFDRHLTSARSSARGHGHLESTSRLIGPQSLARSLATARSVEKVDEALPEEPAFFEDPNDDDLSLSTTHPDAGKRVARYQNDHATSHADEESMGLDGTDRVSEQIPSVSDARSIAPEDPLKLPDRTADTGANFEEVGSHLLGKEVRHLMRQVANTAVVITVLDPEAKLRRRQPFGATVSSFTTVTLDPPHISFNIRHPSQSLDAIRSARGFFRVHVLRQGHRSACIADMFSKGNDKRSLHLRCMHPGIRMPIAHGVPNAAASHAPEIRTSDVLAAFQCELVQEVTVADHVIIVAKVNTMSKTSSNYEPALLYHDGKYKTLGRSTPVSRSHEEAELAAMDKPPGGTASAVKIQSMLWKRSLFVRLSDRLDFVAALKAYVDANPRLLQLDLTRAVATLMNDLKLPPAPLGADLPQLVDACRTDAGLPSHLLSEQRDLPILDEFYGRVSPHEAATLAARARELLAAEPRLLTADLKHLFRRIGLGTIQQGLLVSDIVEQCREDGIIQPWRRLDTSDYAAVSNVVTIERVEQAEIKIRQHLTGMTAHEAAGISTLELLRVANEGRWLLQHVANVRLRIMTEVCAPRYEDQFFDISGHLDQPQARIVIERYARSFVDKNIEQCRQHVSQSVSNVLQDLGVHPMVSGIDPLLLAGQFRYAIWKSTSAVGVWQRINAILRIYFEKGSFSLPDLQARANRLVERYTMQVMRWSTWDIFAALGIDSRSKMRFPGQRASLILAESHAIPAIVAQALADRYGKGTAEEDAAIAQFLLSEYGFDVLASSNRSQEDTSPTLSPHDSTAASAADLRLDAHMADGILQQRSSMAETQQIYSLIEKFSPLPAAARPNTSEAVAMRRPDETTIRKVHSVGPGQEIIDDRTNLPIRDGTRRRQTAHRRPSPRRGRPSGPRTGRDGADSYDMDRDILNSHDVDEFKWRHYLDH